jgi:multidrug efflux pump subunit AcrA (membrane-fusion protein)
VKKLLLSILLVGAALLGIGAWAYFPRTYVLGEQQLKFTHVQRGTLRDAVSATGRLEPRETIAVPTEAPGIVLALLARPNDVVRAGALLARLDDRKARLDMDEAANGLEAAKAGLAQALAVKKGADLELRFQTELEKKGGFRSERDKAQVQVEAAEAGIAAAQQRQQAAEIALKKAREALRPRAPPTVRRSNTSSSIARSSSASSSPRKGRHSFC